MHTIAQKSTMGSAKFVGKFVLADLYDLATHKVHWTRYAEGAQKWIVETRSAS